MKSGWQNSPAPLVIFRQADDAGAGESLPPLQTHATVDLHSVIPRWLRSRPSIYRPITYLHLPFHFLLQLAIAEGPGGVPKLMTVASKSSPQFRRS